MAVFPCFGNNKNQQLRPAQTPKVRRRGSEKTRIEWKSMAENREMDKHDLDEFEPIISSGEWHSVIGAYGDSWTLSVWLLTTTSTTTTTTTTRTGRTSILVFGWTTFVGIYLERKNQLEDGKSETAEESERERFHCNNWLKRMNEVVRRDENEHTHFSRLESGVNQISLCFSAFHYYVGILNNAYSNLSCTTNNIGAQLNVMNEWIE